jgi:hypothetical protein
MKEKSRMAKLEVKPGSILEIRTEKGAPPIHRVLIEEVNDKSFSGKCTDTGTAFNFVK